MQSMQERAAALGVTLDTEQLATLSKNIRSSDKAVSNIRDVSGMIPAGIKKIPQLTEEQEQAIRKQIEIERANDAREIAGHAKKRLAESMLGRAAIPKRFLSCSFDGYDVTSETQAKNFETCRRYAERFSVRPATEGTGLMLIGKTGTGKTHLAAAIANKIIENGYQAVYSVADQMIRDIRASWGGKGDESEAIKKFVSPDLLIIDEIGAGHSSESEKTHYFQVINARYEEVKPTILITNLALDELIETIGDRSVDRMRDASGSALIFDWESRRGKF